MLTRVATIEAAFIPGLDFQPHSSRHCITATQKESKIDKTAWHSAGLGLRSAQHQEQYIYICHSDAHLHNTSMRKLCLCASSVSFTSQAYHQRCDSKRSASILPTLYITR